MIETKLDNISNGVDNIRIDLRANEKRVSDIDNRLTRVEESTKQAHKRIDEISPDKADFLSYLKGGDINGTSINVCNCAFAHCYCFNRRGKAHYKRTKKHRARY
ncbi:hypothetical protein J416_09554 [Gracilibacillus halophilus YIM-C55.5]|uniref:Uncharacterized protein n=1 Tax=Gracilibacillus halophilus YIM-C55.5 TaxID=1308866 RepID=N4W8V3_9BACI|nr:hypothetical protein J416_09554 [Gracilibacillus halophilus YIM-C55.5]